MVLALSNAITKGKSFPRQGAGESAVHASFRASSVFVGQKPLAPCSRWSHGGILGANDHY